MRFFTDYNGHKQVMVIRFALISYFFLTKIMQNNKEAITICKMADQRLINGSRREGKTETIQ